MKEESKEITEAEYVISARYTRSPYDIALEHVKKEIQGLNEEIANVIGLREKDTGLATPSLWNLEHDKVIMNTEKALRVGTLLQVLKKDEQKLPRYIVNFKHEGRYVVGLG